METEGWGCQAGDSRAFYHLLGAFWVEFRRREGERERKTKRQRRREHTTDQKGQTRPSPGGWAWGRMGVRVEEGPTPSAARAPSPSPNLPEQCPSPKKDSNHLSQEELQTAACEAGVDFGACGAWQGG